MCRFFFTIEWLFCFILLLVIDPITGQNNEPFDLDREWIEGVYLNYEEFLKNNPTIRNFSIETKDEGNNSIGRNYIKIKSINYKTEKGYTGELKKKHYWGLCKNGNIYIAHGKALFRLSEIASIMLFDKSNDNYLNEYAVQLALSAVAMATNLGTSNSPSAPANTQKNKRLLPGQVFYVDFYEGKLRDYNFDSLRILLYRDRELSFEYDSIVEPRNQEEVILYFVKKYNKRNPPIVQTGNTQFGGNALLLKDALKED